MAFLTHPDIGEIIQCEGYLFWNPTSLASEAGWGTKLGFCEGGVQFSPGYQIAPIKEEETGEAVQDIYFLGATPTLTTVLQNYNAIALATLFPGMTTGAALKIPGGLTPGTKLSSATYSKPLLFVPADTTNHPCVLLQMACPNLPATAKLLLSHSKKTLFPVVFNGIPKTTAADGTAYFGLLSGAVLR